MRECLLSNSQASRQLRLGGPLYPPYTSDARSPGVEQAFGLERNEVRYLLTRMKQRDAGQPHRIIFAWDASFSRRSA